MEPTSSPVPPPASPLHNFKQKPIKGNWEWLKFVLAVIIGLGGPGAYYFYNQHVKEEKEKADQAAAAAYELQRPHNEAKVAIDKILKSGQDLPACPLIFPLLDKHKKVTNLGSYISYMAALQTSFLPESELSVPVIGDEFQCFALFETTPFDIQKAYRKELPKDIQAKDFAEGTWAKNKKGYKISLRFWGTRPEKKYQKQFDAESLHLVPNWIAVSTHDWMGFQETPAQAAYLAKPAFSTDQDFIKGANVESLRRYCPGQICGWDKVVQRNPDSTWVFLTHIEIEDDRQGGTHTREVKARLDQYPNDTQLKLKYIDELNKDKQYEPAVKIVLDLLNRDANNYFLNHLAFMNLWQWNFVEETLALNKIWCQRHPENIDPWVQQARIYQKYAWLARGSGLSSTITPEGAKLFKERMDISVAAAQKAVSLAPDNGNTWVEMVSLGTGAEFQPKDMKGYFLKAVQWAPANMGSYVDYLDYLAPKWFGTEKDQLDLLNQYWKNDPYMVSDMAWDAFWDYQEIHSSAERIAQVSRVKNNMKRSHYLEIYEKAMKEYFRQHPYDSITWGNYAHWMLYLNKRDDVLAWALKVVPKNNPELKALYPTIVVNVLNRENAYLYGQTTGVSYWDRPDVVKLNGEALRALVKADPDNLNYWNRLGCFDIDHKFYKEAKTCYNKIGDQRDDSVWNKFKFNQGMVAVQANAK